jgi:hypothetical protein
MYVFITHIYTHEKRFLVTSRFFLKAKHRILLTGTPLQNNLLELMSLLIFVMPSLFAGKQTSLKNLFSKTPVSHKIITIITNRIGYFI